MPIEVKKVVEIHDGDRKWREGYVTSDPADVYHDLAYDLMNRHIFHASYIRSVRQTPRYDGTRTIVVTYDNNCRATYTIPSH